MGNGYSIDKDKNIHVDGNTVPLKSWLGDSAKKPASDKSTSPKKNVRFAPQFASRFESSSTSQSKTSAAKPSAPQPAKASDSAARPTFLATQDGYIRAVPPRTNLFYEMGTVSGAVANFTKNLLLGVVGFAQKIVEVALMGLRRLVAVPAIVIGGAVGAIIGLFSPRWYDSGLWAASGAMTGVSLTFKVEKAVKAVTNVVVMAPLKGVAYGLSACAFVVALPVSIVASPIVAAVKNYNR